LGRFLGVQCKTGAFVQPPHGRKWVIISGMCNHVTGTISYFKIKDEKGSGVYYTSQIALAAEGSDTYPMFNSKNDSIVYGKPRGRLEFDRKFVLNFNGGANSYLNLLIWEEEI